MVLHEKVTLYSTTQCMHHLVCVFFSVIVNIYSRRFIVTIIAVCFVIGADICWTVKHLRWHSTMHFTCASTKMVNMNNHMIIFPSSPFGAWCMLCTYYVHAVSSFFCSSCLNKYAFMHFIWYMPCGEWMGVGEWLQLMVYDLKMVLRVLWILCKKSYEIGESTAKCLMQTIVLELCVCVHCTHSMSSYIHH